MNNKIHTEEQKISFLETLTIKKVQKNLIKQIVLDAGRVVKSDRGSTAQPFVEHTARMMANQNCQCAICKTKFANLPKRAVHLDHNHKTGATRGWLCANCNSGIGKLNDGRLFNSALRYLRK